MAGISALVQGAKLEVCCGPERADGECTGGTVGYDGIVDITVSQLRGPMGWYDVAIFEFENAPDMIMPLHMADEIRLAEGKDGED